MIAREVPIVDIGPFLGGNPVEQSQVSTRVGAALKQVGFFVATNHGLPPAIMETAARQGAAFFDMSVEQKLDVKTTPVGLPRGYLPFGSVSLAKTFEGADAPPDIKESYAVGPEHLAKNRWPTGQDKFSEAMVDCYVALDGVMTTLLSIFAMALDLPDGFFDEKFEGHDSTLRIFNYPSQATPPLPGQLRAGAHTDYGAVTLVRVENDVAGGLQVRTQNGEWEDVHAPDDSLVINVGDLMMMWTNDVWLSNVHRVVNPTVDHLRSDTRRQTIAFFASPRSDVMIECIPSCQTTDRPGRYAPITAGAHRLNKVRASTP
jgi:isopenicillin N synthase-like dioxygenase